MMSTMTSSWPEQRVLSRRGSTMISAPSFFPGGRLSSATADSSIAVSCEQVTKEFGVNGTKTVALRGVDLDVDDGKLTLLVGPSGCGKTTLISIIAGLLNPTQGKVSVFGTDLAKLSGRKLVQFRAQKIGFVFQQYNLLPALSAAENA